jgi:hypothetical protein
VLVLSQQRSEGDLVVPSTLTGVACLVVGTLTSAVVLATAQTAAPSAAQAGPPGR